MKSQVKILFVITQGFWGGAQKYVLDLATHLDPLYDITVALGREDAEHFGHKLKAVNPSIKIFPLTHLKREISPLHDLLAIRELKQLYQSRKPDIVHLNSTKAGVLGSLAKTAQTKIIYTAHGWVFLEPLGSIRKAIYRYAETYTAPYKDAVIVLSKEDKAVAQTELHIPENHLYTIPLGISPIYFLTKTDAQQKLMAMNPNIDGTKVLALTIANHYPTKGLDILIQAVSQLSTEEKNKFQFCIIGDGPEHTRLQTDININHLEQTIFLLPSIENAAQYLLAADLFILPSRKEGLPYVILEALQAGLPLIATQVGGLPTLLANTPETTLLAPGDSVALTRALQDFLTSDHPETKREYSGNTLSAMVETTQSLYQRLF